MSASLDQASPDLNYDAASTRHRILVEASRLFRIHGYHATTTRDIAGAVNIRQPSLFYHFPSKSSIVIALFESDLDDALRGAIAIASQSETAANRLFRYICDDIDRVAASPYELSGVYREDVIGNDEFAEWAAKRRQLHLVIESIVRDGIESGEFIAVDLEVVREMIIGALARVLSSHSGRGSVKSGLGAVIATLLVRGILVQPERVSQLSSG